MSSLRDAVRDKLREDKVKLWLPPYDDASKVDALAKAYAAALQAPEPDVAAHLADLRQSALAKLAQRTLITLQGTNFSVRVSTELPGAVARAEEFSHRSLRTESHYIPAARHALGAALLNCGDARAAATLERALREKRSYGEDGAAVAAVLNDLGIASGEEERFREALEIYASRSMLETKDAACARLNLGNALCRRGRYREAKHEYERALSVLTQMHPGNDADVAKALGNLGVVADYLSLIHI